MFQSEFMRDAFYILREEGGVPQGPYFRTSLAEMAERGELTADSPVLHNGEWYTYAQLPPALPCPPTYMAWSLVNVFCCFPFSIVAVHQSSRVAGLYEQGQYKEAQAASRAALRWNIVFSIAVVVLLVFCWFCFRYAYEAWQEHGEELQQIIAVPQGGK